jgi:hypothetical protein
MKLLVDCELSASVESDAGGAERWSGFDAILNGGASTRLAGIQ